MARDVGSRLKQKEESNRTHPTRTQRKINYVFKDISNKQYLYTLLYNRRNSYRFHSKVLKIPKYEQIALINSQHSIFKIRKLESTILKAKRSVETKKATNKRATNMSAQFNSGKNRMRINTDTNRTLNQQTGTEKSRI